VNLKTMNSIGGKVHEEELEGVFSFKDFHWSSTNSVCIKPIMTLALATAWCLNVKMVDLSRQRCYKPFLQEVKKLLHNSFHSSSVDLMCWKM
jgi:hypothetical protein